MSNTSETPKPHILIVDDDAEIRDLLSRFLSKHDFRVTTAKDGREMEQALKDWSIDLIVLDLMLPGDDGLTLCRRVRADSFVPIIMLTAMAEDVDRIIGLEVGADDYLPKPFNPRELAARIKAVLRRVSAPPVATAGNHEAKRCATAPTQLRTWAKPCAPAAPRAQRRWRWPGPWQASQPTSRSDTLVFQLFLPRS